MVSKDIMMIAMDLDNKKIYFGKNGGWLIVFTLQLMLQQLRKFIINTTYVYRSIWFWQLINAYWNFGNGYFGTTAVSSAGTNASGK